MINLKVDEAYAFDYLAILKVKSDLLNSKKNDSNYFECREFLKSQINNNTLWEKIENSIEFTFLVKANTETFQAVELARYGNTTAKNVDDCNMNRYKAKVDFQKTFFPQSEIKETKS
jgi:hypothetical protein